LGIKISKHNRDLHFDRDIPDIVVILDNGERVDYQLTDSFWRTCIEIWNMRIGKWIIETYDIKPPGWNKDHPPHPLLERISEREYCLSTG